MLTELWSDLRYRVCALFRRDAVEEELDAELRFHIEHEAAKYEAAGLPPDEALRRARLAFGGVDRIKEDTRDARGIAVVESAAQDLRYAVRVLRRAPAYTAAALLTIGLGVGAVTAIFSIVDALMLHPLPFVASDRLVYVRQISPQTCPRCYDIPLGNFLELRRSAANSVQFVAAQWWDPIVRGRERTEVINGARVTADFFRVLGAAPRLGRLFIPADTVGKEEVVLSEALWRSHYGADSTIIGRAMSLDGTQRTIVGVLAAAFDFPPRARVWTTLPLPAQASHEDWRVDAFGRLRSGMPLSQATTRVSAIGTQLLKSYPKQMRGWTIALAPMREWHEDTRPALLVFVGAGALLLLIACVNLAGLLVARLTARSRELAVRAAIGASQWRLARQLLLESVVVALVGCALGVIVAIWAVSAVHGGVPEPLASFEPGWPRMHVNARVLTFAAVVAASVGLLVGALPLARFGRLDLVGGLKESARSTGGARSGRVRRILVVAQMTLSLVLLTTAGLLVRSVAKMTRADVGVRTNRILTMTLQRGEATSAEESRRPDYFGRLELALRALPGVKDAGMVYALPLSHHGSFTGFQIVGRPLVSSENRPQARFQVATPGYFATLGIPTVGGRTFVATDARDSARVIVVNRMLAGRYFGNEPAIDRALHFGHDSARYTIVGVVGDVHHDGPSDDVAPEIYYPQFLSRWRTVDLAVRTAGDPASLAPSVLRAIRAYDPNLAVNHVRTMEDIAAEFMSPYRVMLGIMLGLAIVALTMSAVGLYGVVSYSVAQRTREFGIRIALGARTSQIGRLVMSESIGLALRGAALGFILAVLAARVMRFLLYGVGPADPATLIAVGLTLAAVACGAAYLPARHATRSDPVASLRAE